MNDNSKLNSAELMELTAEIVAAYVSNNPVQPDALADLIGSVDAALRGLALGATPAVEPVELVPAVSVRKSITPDFIVCLEDGKKFKSLKRHLRTSYDMTPEEYRAKWGLPHDYPMVAPNYAAARSALAKASGLGQQRKAAVAKVAAKARRAKR